MMFLKYLARLGLDCLRSCVVQVNLAIDEVMVHRFEITMCYSISLLIRRNFLNGIQESKPLNLVFDINGLVYNVEIESKLYKWKSW